MLSAPAEGASGASNMQTFRQGWLDEVARANVARNDRCLSPSRSIITVEPRISTGPIRASTHVHLPTLHFSTFHADVEVVVVEFSMRYLIVKG